MNSTAARAITFQRRTALAPHERRRDFTQIDNDILDVLTSDEASKVTPSMMKIYVRLYRALCQHQEREGVLYLREREDEHGSIIRAWEQLVAIVGVAGSTAKKAIDWMVKQGIIRYDGYKNRYGIRIWFFRANNSIGQKNLPIAVVTSVDAHVSSDGTPFNKGNFRVIQDVKYRAPAGGGLPVDDLPTIQTADLSSPTLCLPIGQFEASATRCNPHRSEMAGTAPVIPSTLGVPPNMHELPSDLVPLLEHTVMRHFERNMAQATARLRSVIVSDTHEWLETRGIPKAVRVAMREAHDNQRRSGEAVRKSKFTDNGDSETEIDAGTLAERESREAAELHRAQVECVRFSLHAGRTAAEIQAQFSLNGDVWERIMSELKDSAGER